MPCNPENMKRLYAIHARENPTIRVKIRKDSGILEAIDKAVNDRGESKTEFVLEALREALIRDGYLTPETPESEETT